MSCFARARVRGRADSTIRGRGRRPRRGAECAVRLQPSRVERRPPERAANIARSQPPRWPMMARPAPSPSREPLMAAVSPSTTVLDSILFRDAFGTPRDARGVLRPRAARALRRGRGRARQRRGALRRHPGRGGRGDRAARATSTRSTSTGCGARPTIVGYPILPLVHQLVEAVRRGRPLRALGRDDAGHHGHRRRAADPRRRSRIVGDDIAALRSILAALAQKHRDTPMAGRTHLQQALPVTFGYKAAVWLAMFDRHAERLARAAAARAGRPVRRRRRHPGLARRQGLRRAGGAVRGAGARRAGVTWHVARDGIAETVNFLALVTGTLGKIAFDVMLMSATEFGEVDEPFVAGPRRLARRCRRSAIRSRRELMLAAAKARAPARRADARRDGPGFRARHRPVARRMDRDAGELRADRRRAAPGASSRSAG